MRKAFLLRVDPELLAHVQRWADDDLRSLNAQIEYLLRRSLRDSGRVKGDAAIQQRPRRKSSEREDE